MKQLSTPAVGGLDVFFRAAISIDLVLFTMHHGKLAVLLRDQLEPPFEGKMGLPGKLLFPNIDTDTAMVGFLMETTGVEGIYCRQLQAFTAVGRHPMGRVITVAYYAVVAANRVQLQPGYKWCEVDKIPDLGFDHNSIFEVGFETLQKGLRRKPVVFELMPKEFSLVEMHAIFEQAYGRELDTRNFRRKVLASGLLVDTGKKRQVNGNLGKPPKLYRFNRAAFQQAQETAIGYYF